MPSAPSPTQHHHLAAWLDTDPAERAIHFGGSVTVYEAKACVLRRRDTPSVRAMLHLFPADPDLTKLLP